MRILSKEEFEHELPTLKTHLEEHDDVFIYPTDTIYGIGCNAEDHKAVEKIRKLKVRSEAPFSVIAPSKDWILEHCEVDDEAGKWLEKLPGPYTLILNVKKGSVADNVNPDKKTLGVRIPDHWIKDAVSKLGFPVVTTSVNKTGTDYLTKTDEMDDDFKAEVAFFVDEGEIDGKPSKIIDLVEGTEVER